MLLQAKVKNDPEVLRHLTPNIMQMIGATSMAANPRLVSTL